MAASEAAMASVAESAGKWTAIGVGTATFLGRAAEWLNANQGMVCALVAVAGLGLQWGAGRYRERKEDRHRKQLFDLERAESEERIRIAHEEHAARMRRLDAGVLDTVDG